MACTDVQTIQAGNGTKTQFSFDFPYIFKSEIHVYFWNAVTKEYDEILTDGLLSDDTNWQGGSDSYPWQITDANPTIVEFTGTAPPSPATPVDPGEPTVDNVKIRRITKIDDIRALFNPGSAIRSDDLNNNFEQLRYAIEEANCAGIPDDVDQYLKDYYWDRYDNTLYDGDTWVSDDTKIATTAALDARFQDEVNDTFTKAELAAASNIMPDDDVAVPTTGALNDYINEVITNDIGTDGTGITVTDDGDGTITLGLADNTIDFDKIKDADQIKLADQVADPDVVGTDNNIFTAQAATRRFNNYYQNDAPSTTDGVGIGQVWVDPNDDLTLSVWSGSNWVGITSGGTFSNQPKVVYVDANSGDDSNDGHRISRPKKTIAAALSDINSDSVYGDGSIVSVAPGIYAETLPLDIQKNDVGIIGQSLRTCIIHPKIPAADQSTYDVDTPHSQELQTMFRVNSGSYFTNLTLTGLKASGTRGGNSLYTDSTYGLPTNQGWNFGFYPNAVIKKSPYIQNVTNFSDSQINNVNFTPHTPGEGAAGDLDSAPTGGGILVDGSVPAASSPLRSMVCDSYTHTALDGPGIFVTNNGYCQATSSYAFFNHAHITCVNGGQANLAASTTDFGRYGLVADGKSSTAIFTSNVDGAASDGAISFNINEPTAGSGWFGDTERPATNMLVEVNSVIYPILSATANTDSEGGNGWTVTISRPDSNNRSTNLGLNGAISDNAAVSFYLRSMIASSGHTMEYVGSGTDYTALPENGGVPVESSQKIELNNGKIWAATTDHNGKFLIGGNQTDDPIFEVDQQLGFVTIPEGSIAFNLLSDLTPQLGGNLDVNGNEIVSTGNGDITINPAGTGKVGVGTSSPAIPLDVYGADTNANGLGDVKGQLRVFNDTTAFGSSPRAGIVFSTKYRTSPDVPLDGAAIYGGKENATDANKDFFLAFATRDESPNEAVERMRINSSGNVGIGNADPGALLHVADSGDYGVVRIGGTNAGTTGLDINYSNASFTATTIKQNYRATNAGALLDIDTGIFTVSTGSAGTERLRIDSSGNVGIGTTSPSAQLHLASSVPTLQLTDSDTNGYSNILQSDKSLYISADRGASGTGALILRTNGTNERMRIDSSGRVLVGTTTPGLVAGDDLTLAGSGDAGLTIRSGSSNSGSIYFSDGTAEIDQYKGLIQYTHNGDYMRFLTANTERMRIDSSGNVGIGRNNPTAKLALQTSADEDIFQVIGYNFLKWNGSNQLHYGGYDSSQWATLTFSTSGSERLRINSSGNVGIGTTSPNQKIHIHSTGSASAYLQSTNVSTGSGTTDGIVMGMGDATNAYFWNYENGGIVFATNAQQRAVIDSSGNVGIGATSINSSYGTNVNIHTTTTNGARLKISDGTSSNGNTDGLDIIHQSGVAYIIQRENNSIRFSTNNAERMRLDENGLVSTLAGGNSTNYKIRNTAGSSSSIYFIECLSGATGVTSGGTHRFLVATNGGISNYQSNDTNLCDEREKKNIETLDSTWGCLKNWELKKFHYNEDADTDDKRYGVIAQQIEEHCPELIAPWLKQSAEEAVLDDDGNVVTSAKEEILRKGVKEQQMMWMAIKALQEAQDRIETLEAKVAALEAG